MKNSQIAQKIQTMHNKFTDNIFISLLLKQYPIGEGKTIYKKLYNIYEYIQTNILVKQKITNTIQLYKLLDKQKIYENKKNKYTNDPYN